MCTGTGVRDPSLSITAAEDVICVGPCVMVRGMDCGGRRTLITMLRSGATGEYGDMSVFVFSTVSMIL
jgi:hypothetical protein